MEEFAGHMGILVARFRSLVVESFLLVGIHGYRIAAHEVAVEAEVVAADWRTAGRQEMGSYLILGIRNWQGTAWALADKRQGYMAGIPSYICSDCYT